MGPGSYVVSGGNGMSALLDSGQVYLNDEGWEQFSASHTFIYFKTVAGEVVGGL